MAKLPVEIEEKSYTVLDTSEDAIMLHVNHGHVSFLLSLGRLTYH